MSTVVVSVKTATRRAPKKELQVIKPIRKTRQIASPGITKPLRGVSADELAKHPISSFANAVYALTQDIPAGYVTTYGAMAKVLNSSPRAVGQALRRNPFAPTVPWYAFSLISVFILLQFHSNPVLSVLSHRVIAQSGLGGFFGAIDGYQLERKMKLLRSEGVQLATENAIPDDKLQFGSIIVDGGSILDHEQFEQKLKERSKGFVFETSRVKSEASEAKTEL